MPPKKRGLRARAPESAAYTKERKLAFDNEAFIELLDSHTRKVASPVIEQETVTVAEARDGFRTPVVVRAQHKHNLGLRMPKATLTVRDVARLTCERNLIPILDVKLQSSAKRATLDEWAQYWENVPRPRILNVISLEISGSVLGAAVKAPAFVDQVDWSATAWPRDAPPPVFQPQLGPTLITARRMLGLEPAVKGDLEPTERTQSARLASPPRVRKYVLMSVAGSFTDFHADFGGTSVWYHVLKGAKRMYLAAPTPENLGKFKAWSMSAAQQTTPFAAYASGRVASVNLTAGDTLVIPSGWIHAVYTPVDSIVFGGNFLTYAHIESQLRVCAVEDATKVHPEARFPANGTIMWYALLRAADALNDALGFDEWDGHPRAVEAFDKAPTTSERRGLKALVRFMRRAIADAHFAPGMEAAPDCVPNPAALCDAVDALLAGRREYEYLEKYVRVHCGSDAGLSTPSLDCAIRVPARFHPDNRAQSLLSSGGSPRRRPGELKERAAAVAGRFVKASAVAALADAAETVQEGSERRRLERERAQAHAAARNAAIALELPPLPPLKKPRLAYLRLPPHARAGEAVDVPLPPGLLSARCRRLPGQATTRVVVPASALPHRVLRVSVPPEDMDGFVVPPAPVPVPSLEEIRAAYQQEQAAPPPAAPLLAPPPPATAPPAAAPPATAPPRQSARPRKAARTREVAESPALAPRQSARPRKAARTREVKESPAPARGKSTRRQGARTRVRAVTRDV